MGDLFSSFFNFCDKYRFLFLSLLLFSAGVFSIVPVSNTYPSIPTYLLSVAVWGIAYVICIIVYELAFEGRCQDKKRKFFARLLISEVAPLLILLVFHLFVHAAPWLVLSFGLMDASRVVLFIPQAFDLN